MSLYRCIFAAGAAIALAGVANAELIFSAPEVVSQSDGRYQLARNPRTSAAFGGDGMLHVTYWEGSEATNLANPSHVFYRTRTTVGNWSPRVEIDAASIVASQHLGGRQPSLAIDSRGDVWVAWHDHRHGTSGGGYNDNLEIYAARSPFVSDLRITTTTAGGAGDNGYLPRIAARADGSLAIAWYDFTANANVGDVYAIDSDTVGNFPASPIASARLTDETARGGAPSFTVPDVAVDADGNSYFAWTTGTGATGGDLYFGEKIAVTSAFTSVKIADGVSSFFDTPRIDVAPNGDVWIVYTDTSNATNLDVRAMRRAFGDSTFSPMTISGDSVREDQPTIAFTGDGVAHFAYIQGTSPSRTLVYRTWDSGAGFSGPAEVTSTAGNFVRVSLAMEDADRPHFIVEESLGFTASRILQIEGGPLMAAGNWVEYR